MRHHREGLVEPQGVNAVRPVARGTVPDHTWLEAHPPPTGLAVSGMLSDAMVGLPGQRPGYPGQQRSVETS
jgi:hypothetical protein